MPRKALKIRDFYKVIFAGQKLFKNSVTETALNEFIVSYKEFWNHKIAVYLFLEP